MVQYEGRRVWTFHTEDDRSFDLLQATIKKFKKSQFNQSTHWSRKWIWSGSKEEEIPSPILGR